MTNDREVVKESRARWHTVWWLLLGSLAVAGCALTAGWLDHQEALAFRHSSHQVTARVVESDCWMLCRGGPTVRVTYRKSDGLPAVGGLTGVTKRFRVGDTIMVIYSDDPATAGDVFLPPAESSLAGDTRWPALVCLTALLIAFAAWALPANLRRLDRRHPR